MAKHGLVVLQETAQIMESNENGVELNAVIPVRSDAFVVGGDDQFVQQNDNVSSQSAKEEKCDDLEDVEEPEDDVKQDSTIERNERIHSVTDSLGALVSVSTQVPASTQPESRVDWRSRRILLLKRSPLLICSVLVLIVGIICAAQVEYRITVREYRSSAYCNNSVHF